jgi:hypothetical protein
MTRLLTQKEVAETFSRDRTWVWRQVRSGRLKFTLVSGRRRYSEDQIATFLLVCNQMQQSATIKGSTDI